MIPLCTSATRLVSAPVRVGVDVVRRAVGGPAGVPDAGRGLGQRRLDDRLLEVGELAGASWPTRSRRRRPGRCRRSRSRGTRGDGGRRRPRPAPASVRRSPRFRTCSRVYSGRTRGRGRVATARMPAMSPTGGFHNGSDDTGREPSPYVELERGAWAALAKATESPLTQDEITRLRGLGDSLDLHEVQQVYLPAVPPAQHVRRERRTAAPPAGGVPRPAAAAADTLRDRPGRLGRGRQVHDRARAAADARPLARAPQRRAGHDRRLPPPQRRAAAPRAAPAQGLPGVLRPQGAAALRRGHQVRQGRGRGADLLAPRLRRGPGREDRRSSARTS